MKLNMGNTDRIIRVLIAIVLTTLYFIHQISGVTAIILLITSGIFILTSIFSFCPLYLPFGLSTRKSK